MTALRSFVSPYPATSCGGRVSLLSMARSANGMSFARIGLTAVLVALAVIASGCDNSGTPTAATPNLTYLTEVVTGTVPVPVDGVLQSDSKPFTVAQSGGSVTITLTSATETLPGGTLLVNVTMGLGVGTVTNGTCTVPAGSFTPAQASSTPQLGGSSVSAGTYCVQVSDYTNQLGPVAYTVVVTHA